MNTNNRLLRMPQVVERIGLKKSSIYARVQAGTFPKPIKLGGASVWSEHEVDDWITRQVEQQRRAA